MTVFSGPVFDMAVNPVGVEKVLAGNNTRLDYDSCGVANFEGSSEASSAQPQSSSMNAYPSIDMV